MKHIPLLIGLFATLCMLTGCNGTSQPARGDAEREVVTRLTTAVNNERDRANGTADALRHTKEEELTLTYNNDVANVQLRGRIDAINWPPDKVIVEIARLNTVYVQKLRAHDQSQSQLQAISKTNYDVNVGSAMKIYNEALKKYEPTPVVNTTPAVQAVVGQTAPTPIIEQKKGN